MKSFQEFAQEAFLEISKQSASLVLELCFPDNSLSTAISALLTRYNDYLSSVEKSLRQSIETYDQELNTLQERIDTFKRLFFDQQATTIQEELKASKDMIANCINSAMAAIDIETEIIEEAKAVPRTGLEKEAADVIAKVAEMEVRSNTNLIKCYREQSKVIIETTLNDESLKGIIEKKASYLQGEYDRLLVQKKKAEKDLVAITETRKKLSPQKPKS